MNTDECFKRLCLMMEAVSVNLRTLAIDQQSLMTELREYSKRYLELYEGTVRYNNRMEESSRLIENVDKYLHSCSCRLNDIYEDMPKFRQFVKEEVEND